MYIIGLMSGSSLDGLDIAFAELSGDEKIGITWHILSAETVPFSPVWQARLRDIERVDAQTFARTHTYFGRYLAELVNGFLERQHIKPHEVDLISSHGHTVFHDPQRCYTTQIGCGAALCAGTKIEVACDFRTQDVALNGEGTPLAPLADQFLFAGYDFYLNIGGIANISATIANKMIAFDTSPANQILNRLAQQLGFEYDRNGEIARKAAADPHLASQLQTFDYYERNYPKSLSNQACQQDFYPIIEAFQATTPTKLATMTEHIALKVSEAVSYIDTQEKTISTLYERQPRTLLATGGGALNGYLIEKMAHFLIPQQVKIVVPDRTVIEFKEAILMCLMGYFRKKHIPNTLASVTAAQRNTIGGALYTY